MGERRTKICRPLLFLPAGMISTRPLESLYSNVPANGAPEAKRFLWRPQLSPVLSQTAGGGTQPDSRGQAASSATRWRRRTAFSRGATPRSGRCPGCGVQIGAWVWGRPGLSWLFAAILPWPQLPAVAAPRPSKAGLHTVLGLAWRSAWGS